MNLSLFNPMQNREYTEFVFVVFELIATVIMKNEFALYTKVKTQIQFVLYPSDALCYMLP